MSKCPRIIFASSGMFWEFFIEPNDGHFGPNASETHVY
jgi:hypothetical protein